MGRIADAYAPSGTPRVLTLDIETSAHTVKTWGLHDQNIGLNQIVEVGSVICFAAKWYDQRRTMFYSDHHDGHEAMIDAAWELMDEADWCISYNGRSFDFKHLHREFVLAGKSPPSPHRDVDLLSVARQRFRFASNKLDHVSQQLGIGQKVKHAGFDLWTGCEHGDPKSWAQMKRYCVADCRLTENLYDRLRPWIKNHPHVGLYGGRLDGCPTCGGDLEATDRTFNTASRVYDLMRCVECGATCRPAKSTGVTTLTRGV